jgi:hypothetical protein
MWDRHKTRLSRAHRLRATRGILTVFYKIFLQALAEEERDVLLSFSSHVLPSLSVGTGQIGDEGL